MDPEKNENIANAQEQLLIVSPRRNTIKDFLKGTSSPGGDTKVNVIKYSLLRKIFCCKCFKKDTVLGSEKRKETWRKLFHSDRENNSLLSDGSSEESKNDGNVNKVLDPLEVLTHLYTAADDRCIENLRTCRLNPDYSAENHLRKDLEFFAPQLINFIVFHEDLKNDKLNEFLEEACAVDFFFSHLVYWCLNSISSITLKKKVFEIPVIKEVKDIFVRCCMENTKNKLLLAYYEMEKLLETVPRRTESIENSEKVKNVISKYGTEQQEEIKIGEEKITVADLEIKNYVSVFKTYEKTPEPSENGFLSTINFFEDLIQLVENMARYTKSQERMTYLRNSFMKINKKLPAAVYIPFFKSTKKREIFIFTFFQ